MTNEKCDKFAGFMPKFDGKLPPMPPMPPMPFPLPKFNKEEAEAKKKKGEKDIGGFMDEFDANMLTFWSQVIDMQKSTIESNRDQWLQTFDQLMEMQDTFADSLPKEFPTIPGFSAPSVSPKYLMEELKKFQEMANDHVTEQIDSFVDFYIKSQEQTREVGKKAVGDVSVARKDFAKEKDAKEKEFKEAIAKTKAAKEEKAEPAKKTSAKKTTAKKTTAKKAEPAKKTTAKKAPAKKAEEVKAEPAKEEKAPEFNF